MPWWPFLSSRLITSFSSASGVILIQSEAQRSTPKMPTSLAANHCAQIRRVGEAGKAEERRLELQILRLLGSMPLKSRP